MMRVKLSVGALLVLCSVTLLLRVSPEPKTVSPVAMPQAAHEVLHPQFVANAGQFAPMARYCLETGPVSTFFTNTGMRISLPTTADANARHGVFFDFVAASDSATVIPEEREATTHSYLTGDRALVAESFQSLRFEGLYPGVGMRARTANGQLEYDLLLEPGADLDQIVVAVSGATGLTLENDGTLVIATDSGPIRQSIPATWEVLDSGEKRALAASFRLVDGTSFGFDVPDRELSRALVVDPTVSFSTYLGGALYENANDLARGSDGSLFMMVESTSPNFPTAPGLVLGGQAQRVLKIVKLNSTATSITFVASLGGNGSHFPQSMDINPRDEVYVGGHTEATDLPTTVGGAFGGGVTDGFVLKLNASGTGLLFARYLGGAGEDSVREVVLGNGRVYVAATTSSAGLGTGSAFQPTPAGGSEAFVATLDVLDGALLGGTYVGGSQSDVAEGLALDAFGRPYVCGNTGSSDFPVTGAASQGIVVGGTDAFIVRLSADLSSLEAATFLGGTGNETAWSLAVGLDGDVYVTGDTLSPNFPATVGTFGGDRDGYLARFDSGLMGVVFSRLLGGSAFEFLYSVVVRSDGSAIVGGCSASPNYPLTPDAFDNVTQQWDDVITHVGPQGQILFSTFYGGAMGEETTGMILDDCSGELCFAGAAEAGFPTTAGALQPAIGGQVDATLTCFAFTPAPNGPATLGNFVWQDLDCDGVQNANEPGLKGVTVCLFDENSATPNVPVGVTTTDEAGAYAFQVLAGTYSIATKALPGYTITNAGVGTDPALDSDMIPGTSRTLPLVVAACADLPDIDAGYCVCTGPLASAVTLGSSCNLPLDPILTATPPIIGETFTITLTADPVFGGAIVLVFLSEGPVTPRPVGTSGCLAYVDFSQQLANLVVLGPFPIAPDGTWSADVQVPNTPAFFSLQLTIQVRVCAPNGPAGPLSPDWASNGLFLTMGCP